MQEIIFLVAEAPDGGVAARALGASIFTEADTLANLRDAVRDTVHCQFETDNSPQVIRVVIMIDSQ